MLALPAIPAKYRGLKHAISCVEAIKKVLGDEVGLALDCGPGWMMKDVVTFARSCEPMHITSATSNRRRQSRSTPENRSICGISRI